MSRILQQQAVSSFQGLCQPQRKTSLCLTDTCPRIKQHGSPKTQNDQLWERHGLNYSGDQIADTLPLAPERVPSLDAKPGGLCAKRVSALREKQDRVS